VPPAEEERQFQIFQKSVNKKLMKILPLLNEGYMFNFNKNEQ